MKKINLTRIEEIILRQSFIVLIANIPGILAIFIRSCATGKGVFTRLFMLFSWFSWAWMINYLIGNTKLKFKHNSPIGLSRFTYIIIILTIWLCILSTMNITYNKNSGKTDNMTKSFNENYSFNPKYCINE